MSAKPGTALRSRGGMPRAESFAALPKPGALEGGRPRPGEGDGDNLPAFRRRTGKTRSRQRFRQSLTGPRRSRHRSPGATFAGVEGGGLGESRQRRGMFAGRSGLTDKRCRRNAGRAGIAADPHICFGGGGGEIWRWCRRTPQNPELIPRQHGQMAKHAPRPVATVVFWQKTPFFFFFTFFPIILPAKRWILGEDPAPPLSPPPLAVP